MFPCTNCGNSLDIMKGTVVQCFACGVKNSHFESYEVLSHFVQDLFGYPKAIESIEENVENSVLNNRLEIVDNFFSELLLKINEFNTFFVSKISKDATNKLEDDSVKFSRKCGLLYIVLENYILPHLSKAGIKSKYYNYRSICAIYNKAMLGLRFVLEAKTTFQIEDAKELYQKARWNYQEAVEIAENSEKNDEDVQFSEEKTMFSICGELSVLFMDMLTSNPAYNSEKVETIISKLDQISLKQARNLKHQINDLMDLANELPYIMEEIRLSKPLKHIETDKERILYHSEEIIEQFTNARIWIKDINDRYKTMQTEIMKLHCGKMITYLRDYRKEFQNRLDQTTIAFNDKILKVMQTALLDYTLSSTDLLDEVEQGFNFIQLSPSEVIERIRYLKKDLVAIDKELKSFLFDILDLGLPESLKLQNVPSIVSSISDKHGSFDKLIIKYIKNIFNKFTDERDEKRYTIEEQHDKFNIHIRPLVDNLIDVSFTIKADQIPYPLFIEIAMLTTQLIVEEEYKIFFIIENPSKVTISGVNVSFFVPNSFRIKIRQYKIGHIKPNEKLTIETRIIPEQEGLYYFMAMVEYEYSKEMFWMPSIKQQLRVTESSSSNLDLTEDDFLNDLYKKYGRVSNEEQVEKVDDQDDEISGSINTETPEKSAKITKKDDDLLPDI